MEYEIPETYPNRLVILHNNSGQYIFSPELEEGISFCYDLPDYNPNASNKSFEKLARRYYNKFFKAVRTGLPIILLNSNPITLSLLSTLRENTNQKFFENWLYVSFFNDDETLLKAKLNMKPETRLKLKENAILEAINYPFIKKFEIPYGYEITLEYIFDLIARLR
jgi:hypothetical protein